MGKYRDWLISSWIKYEKTTEKCLQGFLFDEKHFWFVK